MMNASVSTKAVSATALDSDLRALCESAWHSAAVPLTIRRFVEESGVDRPGAAMKLATDLLLGAYNEGQRDPSTPISVERLCDLAGAALIGKRPRGRRSDDYSFESYKRRVGHTGKLYFDGLRATIKIPDHVDPNTARVSVAHEIGHLLIHRRGTGYDKATLRLQSSPEEEALAEYCARLLLIPTYVWSPSLPEENLARYAITQSSLTRVTLHAAVTRLGDPDVVTAGVRGAILWRINSQVSRSESISARLTPHWHLCPKAFVPVRKCKARDGSLIAQVAGDNRARAQSGIEEVSIGSFVGSFRIDAFACGTIDDGTRLVLSIFREL
jgi:Zn-dependent peptidase ImmA (M78 family)